MDGTKTYTNSTITGSNTEQINISISNGIAPNPILQQMEFGATIMIWSKNSIMPVFAGNNFLGEDVGCARTNNNSTINSSAKCILLLPRKRIRGPVFSGVYHGWIINTTS